MVTLSRGVRPGFLGRLSPTLHSCAWAWGRSRLLSTLAILEQRDGSLNRGSLSSITAAKQLGGPVHAFVAGADTKAVADEVATAEGLDKVVFVDNDAYSKVLWI